MRSNRPRCAASRTVSCARCKTTWFANGPQPVPEMATAETVSEAEEAFRGVIRPDQPASLATRQCGRRDGTLHQRQDATPAAKQAHAFAAFTDLAQKSFSSRSM